jgi:Phage integrase family
MDVLLDAAGRRRSPVTMPGYHAGRPPGNNGMSYPADPPTVDEIVAVLRHTRDDRHGWRMRAMIVVLWRAGLRVQEALALAEHDLDQRRGSLLARSGKGGRRREVGMDDWGWELLHPWLAARAELPAGPLFCIIDGRTCGRAWSAAAVRHELRRLAARASVRRRFAPHQLRHAHALELAHGRAAEHHPAPARAHQPRHHEHLPPGHRPGGDHHGGADTAGADDVRQRRAAALTNCGKRERLAALPLPLQADPEDPRGARLAGANPTPP